MMSLDEAILHCQGRAKADCSECAREHLQLAEWLEELKVYKELEAQRRILVKAYEVCEIFECNHCGYVESRIEETWVHPSLLGYEGFYRTRDEAEAALKVN